MTELARKAIESKDEEILRLIHDYITRKIANDGISNIEHVYYKSIMDNVQECLCETAVVVGKRK